MQPLQMTTLVQPQHHIQHITTVGMAREIGILAGNQVFLLSDSVKCGDA
mgnify:CR=1 FL=1